MAEHPEGKVFVTVYVPAVLLDIFTCPVEVLTKTNPAGEAEYVPAVALAESVGVGLAELVQNGVAV